MVKQFVQCFLDELVYVILEYLTLQRQKSSVECQKSEPVSDHDQNTLYYICGYLINVMNKKHGSYSGLQNKSVHLKELVKNLQLSSHGNSKYLEKYQVWTNKINRGGLMYPCDALYLLIRQTESVIRKSVKTKNIGHTSLNVEKLTVIADAVVQHHWTSMMGNEVSSHSAFLLEDIISLFVRLRGFAVAKSSKRKHLKEISE